MMNQVMMIFPNYYQYSEWHWLPTNFMFLGSTLIDRGYQPILIDDRLLTREETIQKIDQSLGDTLIVLISTVTGRQLYNARRLAQYIKNERDIPICVGGAHPSALPELTLTDPNIDYVIAGQAEYAVCDLCDAIANSKDLEEDLNRIPNLYYRDHQQNIVKSSAPFRRIKINDLPDLPYFNRGFIDVSAYLNPSTLAVNYTTSSGCVGKCSFCFFHEDYRYSFFDLPRVIGDLKRFKDQFGIKNISFDDPTFFVGTKRIVELARWMLRENIDVKWRANARVNTLKQFTDEEMKLIRESGCDVIHIGLESASERILKLINKHIRAEDAIELIRISEATGITFRFHILLGVPSETIDDLKRTGQFLRRLIRIYPNFDYTVNFFTPYPGNELTRLAEFYGYTAPDTLDGYETIESFTLGRVPVGDRGVVKEMSPWEEDYHLPWFTEEFNREYMQVFREVIPRKESIRTTDGVIEGIYVYE